MSTNWDVQVAIVAAMQAEPAIIAAVTEQGIYNGEVPAEHEDGTKPKLPYYVIGSATENDGTVTFGKRGFNDTIQIRCYSEFKDNAEVLALYKLLHGVLDRKLLVVADAQHVYGRISLLTTGPDEGGKAWAAIAQYRAMLQR